MSVTIVTGCYLLGKSGGQRMAESSSVPTDAKNDDDLLDFCQQNDTCPVAAMEACFKAFDKDR